MRGFWREHRKLHIWAACLAAFLLTFFTVRGKRTWMNALADNVTTPLKRALGTACSRVPFSVAELFYVLAAAALAAFLLCSIVAVKKSRHRVSAVYARFGVLLCSIATVYAMFCLLWGVNYYTDSFCDKSGLQPKPVSAEDLARVTQMFADGASAAAQEVARDENGVFAEPRATILALAGDAYDTVYDEFPFLRDEDEPPKTIRFSRVMSALGFTGFYFPFTGESNLNVDFPAATLGATVAHELAHRRGIASEQECNFLGILTSIRSASAAYRYSGYLTGFVYLGNALCSVDPERYAQIYDALDRGVLCDLAASREYWAQFEGPAEKVSTRVYDGFLKSYGDELGVKSYGACVDLLVLYFG